MAPGQLHIFDHLFISDHSSVHINSRPPRPICWHIIPIPRISNAYLLRLRSNRPRLYPSFRVHWPEVKFTNEHTEHTWLWLPNSQKSDTNLSDTTPPPPLLLGYISLIPNGSRLVYLLRRHLQLPFIIIYHHTQWPFKVSCCRPIVEIFQQPGPSRRPLSLLIADEYWTVHLHPPFPKILLLSVRVRCPSTWAFPARAHDRPEKEEIQSSSSCVLPCRRPPGPVNIDFIWTGAAIIHTNRVQCNVFGPPLNTATELTDSPVHVAVNELPISCIVWLRSVKDPNFIFQKIKFFSLAPNWQTTENDRSVHDWLITNYIGIIAIN